MVSKDTTRKILGIIQRNYNKHPLWADESVGDWFQALIRFDDLEAEEAVRQICRTRKTLPNVAAVIEVIHGQRKSRGNDVTTAQGCGACEKTGWREVVHWYSSKGKLQVTTYLAACDCSKGMRLETSPAVQGWEGLVSKLRADPFTEAVYHSTHAHPHMTTEQRLHPDALADMRERSKGRPVGAWQHLTGVE
jgi:hypothetical protein